MSLMANERDSYLEKNLARSIFYWLEPHDQPTTPGVKKVKRRNYAKVSVSQVAHTHGVPEEQLKKDIETEMAAEESCSGLPFTLVLVVSYACVAMYHLNAGQVNSVEDSIGFDILENANFAFSGPYYGDKGMDDVNMYADFWSWFQAGVMPLLFQQYWTASENRDMTDPDFAKLTEDYPRKDRGKLLNYNRIILGLRLTQERSGDTPEMVSRPCAGGVSQAKDFTHLWGQDCTGASSRQDYNRQPDGMVSRYTYRPQDERWIYLHEDFDHIMKRCEDLQREGWLNYGTRKLEIAMPIYNAEYGLHAIVYCNFFFSRGGHIWKDLVALNAFDFFWKSWRNYAFDGSWLMCVFYIVIMESKEIVSVIREYGFVGIRNEYISFWNLVDWFSVVTALGLCYMIYGNIQMMTTANQQLSDLSHIDEETRREAYIEAARTYVSHLELTVRNYYDMSIGLAVYPMVIVLRLFKAFGAQPRLALVTNTLKYSAIDLAHFLIIFFSVLAMFTVSSIVLFGREVREFVEPFRAFVTCFRTLLGDFDWDEMSQVGRFDAFFWFFPFVVIMVFVLMNMLIAIVMDAYNEVKAEIDGSATLLQQGMKNFSRLRAARQGQLVGMGKILAELQRSDKKISEEAQALADKNSEDDEFYQKEPELLEQESEERIIKIADLKALFKEMKGLQARDLIEHAVMSYYHDNNEAADFEEAISLIRKINSRTQKLKWLDQKRLAAEGQARDNPDHVRKVIGNAFTQMAKAREDLGDWLHDDADDHHIPKEFLDKMNEVAALNFKENHGKSHGSKQGLTPLVALTEQTGASVQVAAHGTSALNDLLPMYGGASRTVPTLTVGGYAELLADEHYVIDACRKNGIDSANDELRKQAVGRSVKIVERDDRDGTVRCHIPGIGLVWFAVSCFAARTKDEMAQREIEGSTTISDHSAGLSMERAEELERELEMGRETVAEAIQAVNELHGRLLNTKKLKHHNIQKFHELRRRAIDLNKNNRTLKTTFERDQIRLRKCTGERDKLFDEVKVMVDRNRTLEAQIASEDHRRRVGR